MEVTILRLPHMDIVLNKENNMEEDTQCQEKQEALIRRSKRCRNQDAAAAKEKAIQENDVKPKRYRMRCNSVMDEDEEEEREEERERERKEPEHRRMNRMRQGNVNDPVSTQ